MPRRVKCQKESIPKSRPSYEPSDFSDIESIPSMEDIEVKDTSDVKSILSMGDIEVKDIFRRKVPSSPPLSPPSTKRSRNVPLMEQLAWTHETEILTALNNIKKQEMILAISRDEARKNKQKRLQIKKYLDEIKKAQDKITRLIEQQTKVFYEFQNRLEITETRILQEIRK